MKLSTNTVFLALSLTACVNGFASVYNNRPAQQRAAFVAVARSMSSTETPETTTAKSLEVVGSDNADDEDAQRESALKRLGLAEDELGLGINPLEMLQWIGTKDDLIQKFKRDNKEFSQERVETEVARFCMDAEMVNAYIKFERNKIENPPDLKEQAQQNLSDPKTIALYAAWLVAGASFGWVKNIFLEPKYASGEWEPIKIELPTPFWITEPAVQAVSSAVSSSVDAVVGSTVV